MEAIDNMGVSSVSHDLKISATLKSSVCHAIGINPNACNDLDVSLLLSYSLGIQVSSEASESDVHNALIKMVEKNPRYFNDSALLEKVALMNDRYNVVSNAFSTDHMKYSDTFSNAIDQMRKEKMRAYFLKLSKSVHQLNLGVSDLTSGLRGNASSKDLQKSVRQIRMSIQSCEHHLKSGIGMALAAGVHPHSVWKATYGLYDLRVSKMASLFERADVVLKSRGVKSPLSRIMKNRQSKWLNNWREIFESFRRSRINKNDIASIATAGLQR
jgi:hypothetical protein